MSENIFDQSFSKSILIHAPLSDVWKALTDISSLKKWMLDEELEIITDWKVGNTILIKGYLHQTYFENKGLVLKFEPNKILQYNHLSSLSNLPDKEENYSVIEFSLQLEAYHTNLTVTLSNFPTESIYKHLLFYWSTTLVIIKKFVETQSF